MDLTLIPGIGPAFKERLQQAGVPDVEALAAGPDVDALAERAQIPRTRLVEFVEAAKTLLAQRPAPDADAGKTPTPREAVQNVTQAVRDAAEDMRVVLRDATATARVKIGSIWHEDVPIVTARLNENEERIVSALRQNGVVLKEQAATAIARINGEVVSGLPIFKERVREGAGQVREEVRVRVKEIRERAERRGLLGRLLRRGPA